MGFEDLIGSIGEEAARQRGAILGRAEAEAREIIRSAEVAGAMLLEGVRERGAAAARSEVARVISRARLAARREVLAARHRLVEEAFRALDERLRAFVASPAYGATLGLLLRESAEGYAGTCTVRCRTVDRAVLERHARTLELEATFEDEPLRLGGVEIATGPDGRVVFRNGLADRLEAARPWLLQEAGREIFGDGGSGAGDVSSGTAAAAGAQGAQP